MNDTGLMTVLGMSLAMVAAAFAMAWDFKRGNKRQARRDAEAEKRAA